MTQFPETTALRAWRTASGYVARFSHSYSHTSHGRLPEVLKFRNDLKRGIWHEHGFTNLIK